MSKYKTPKIQDLIDSGVHFGHQTKRWHPKMEKYIYCVNKGIHIIDLEKTEDLLLKACEFLYERAKEGKTIVFVGTKRQAREIIESEAKRCGAMYIKERWVGGTITNFSTIKKNLDKLIGYMKGREDGSFEKYTKKERLLIDREIEKLQNVYGGVIGLKNYPDVLFIIDPKRERTAIREAKSNNIPVIGLVDTNCDPSGVDFVIPGNDDAIKSISTIVRSLSDAIEEGYKDFDKLQEKKGFTKDIKKEIIDLVSPKSSENKNVKDAKDSKDVEVEDTVEVKIDEDQVAIIEEKLISGEDSKETKVLDLKEVKDEDIKDDNDPKKSTDSIKKESVVKAKKETKVLSKDSKSKIVKKKTIEKPKSKKASK